LVFSKPLVLRHSDVSKPLNPKYGRCYIGGTSKGRLSVHSIVDGKRLCQNVKKEECQILAKQIWKGGFSSPYLKKRVSKPESG